MAKGKLKTAKQIERHVKGIANHYRIMILLQLADAGVMTLDGIVQAVEGNAKTIGEHTRRLVTAGLIEKEYKGKFVEHRLTPYGKRFVAFLSDFQKITR